MSYHQTLLQVRVSTSTSKLPTGCPRGMRGASLLLGHCPPASEGMKPAAARVPSRHAGYLPPSGRGLLGSMERPRGQHVSSRVVGLSSPWRAPSARWDAAATSRRLARSGGRMHPPPLPCRRTWTSCLAQILVSVQIFTLLSLIVKKSYFFGLLRVPRLNIEKVA